MNNFLRTVQDICKFHGEQYSKPMHENEFYKDYFGDHEPSQIMRRDEEQERYEERLIEAENYINYGRRG